MDEFDFEEEARVRRELAEARRKYWRMARVRGAVLAYLANKKLAAGEEVHLHNQALNASEVPEGLDIDPRDWHDAKTLLKILQNDDYSDIWPDSSFPKPQNSNKERSNKFTGSSKHVLSDEDQNSKLKKNFDEACKLIDEIDDLDLFVNRRLKYKTMREGEGVKMGDTERKVAKKSPPFVSGTTKPKDGYVRSATWETLKNRNNNLLSDSHNGNPAYTPSDGGVDRGVIDVCKTRLSGEEPHTWRNYQIPATQCKGHCSLSEGRETKEAEHLRSDEDIMAEVEDLLALLPDENLELHSGQNTKDCNHNKLGSPHACSLGSAPISPISQQTQECPPRADPHGARQNLTGGHSSDTAASGDEMKPKDRPYPRRIKGGASVKTEAGVVQTNQDPTYCGPKSDKEANKCNQDAKLDVSTGATCYIPPYKLRKILGHNSTLNGQAILGESRKRRSEKRRRERYVTETTRAEVHSEEVFHRTSARPTRQSFRIRLNQYIRKQLNRLRDNLPSLNCFCL